jgi:sugar/nucleoside kinase (ribokinase family)
MSPQGSPEVVVAGLAVVDILGRPVSLARPPRRGGLQLIDSLAMTTGGNVPNVAINLAKLGFRTAGITRVGKDHFGAFIRDRLGSHGVNTRGVIEDETDQTSGTFVAVAADGERSFLHTRGCLKNFRCSDVLAHLDLLRQCRIFAFGYLGLLPECVSQLPSMFATIRRETGVKILLDTGGNPRRQPRLLRAILPHLDFFLPSLEEAIMLTGRRTPEAIVRACRDAGAAQVLGVKLGSKGVYIDHGGSAAYLPPQRVRKVVDATGAGDSFIAGFLGATVRGMDPFAAARVGNAVAADCVTAIGASTAIKQFDKYIS